MSLPPDQPPPAPDKPKLTPEERRARHADRLTTIRLRMAIGRKLEDRDITTPAACQRLPLRLNAGVVPPSAPPHLTRRGLLAATLLAAGPAAAQAGDLRTRLSRLRCGANLERWFPVARDNHARRLGRGWWREFRAAGFDHVRMFVPGGSGGSELLELFHQAIEDANAAAPTQRWSPSPR
jgi:hypothetical protein